MFHKQKESAIRDDLLTFQFVQRVYARLRLGQTRFLHVSFERAWKKSCEDDLPVSLQTNLGVTDMEEQL